MKLMLPLTAVLGLLLWGCVHRSAQFAATAYVQSDYGYKVAYSDPGGKSFASGDWTLDNYFVDEMGDLKAKKGNNYEAKREFDEDGDGQISSSETSQENIYDLRLLNRRDNGVIWVKAHPLLPDDAHRDLEVTLNDYADGLSGAGLYAQSNLFSVERVHERHFTTFVTAKNQVTVGDVPGLAGTVELAEVEKLRLDPSFRSAKIRIVLVKFYFYDCGSQFGRHPWPTVTHDGSSCFKRPGLLVVGYYNTVDRFDEDLPEFEHMVQRISFSPGSLMDDVKPPSVAAEPKPADAPAAPPK
ncbi:MAG: hypothetical protein ACLP1X_25760 [Polyangiaceae bacterium]|jgi:hypothetical protein